MGKCNKQSSFNHSASLFEKGWGSYQSNPSCIIKKLFTGCPLSDFLATVQSIHLLRRLYFLDLTALCFMEEMWLKWIRWEKQTQMDQSTKICIWINQQKFIEHYTLFSGDHSYWAKRLLRVRHMHKVIHSCQMKDIDVNFWPNLEKEGLTFAGGQENWGQIQTLYIKHKGCLQDVKASCWGYGKGKIMLRVYRE